MAAPAVGEVRLEEALRAALVEAIEERSDLLRDIVAEVIEDIALVRAIQGSEESEPVSREHVFGILDSTE